METAAPDAPAACSYELDYALNLVAADEAFATFALANEAPELKPPRCLGRPVLSYVADSTTAHLYRQLFERVRLTSRQVTFPIRCDSPSLRRYLELCIAPRTGGFRIETTVTRIELREELALLDAGRVTDGTLLRMCSWCKKVDADGAWLEVEDAVEALGLFHRTPLPGLSHGMCESCYSDILARTTP